MVGVGGTLLLDRYVLRIGRSAPPAPGGELPMPDITGAGCADEPEPSAGLPMPSLDIGSASGAYDPLNHDL